MQTLGVRNKARNMKSTKMPKKNDCYVMEPLDDFGLMLDHIAFKKVRISNNRGIFEMGIEW